MKQQGDDRVVGDNLRGYPLITALEEPAALGCGHDGAGLQQPQADSEVTGVLGELGGARLPLLVELLEAGDDDPQELDDDGGGDVGHDAQREDAQLEQRAAGEDVDEAEQPLVLGLADTGLDVGQVDAGCRQDRPEPEQGHDAEGEEQLRPEVWRSERLGERAEHSISCGLGVGSGPAGSKAERRGAAPTPDYPAEVPTWALRQPCNAAEMRVLSRLLPAMHPRVIQRTSSQASVVHPVPRRRSTGNPGGPGIPGPPGSVISRLVTVVLSEGYSPVGRNLTTFSAWRWCRRRPRSSPWRSRTRRRP